LTTALQSTILNRLSGRWDSNPRPSPWQGDVLPLNHARIETTISGGQLALLPCIWGYFLIFSMHHLHSGDVHFFVFFCSGISLFLTRAPHRIIEELSSVKLRQCCNCCNCISHFLQVDAYPQRRRRSGGVLGRFSFTRNNFVFCGRMLCYSLPKIITR
jgi:hypothetical protein